MCHQLGAREAKKCVRVRRQQHRREEGCPKHDVYRCVPIWIQRSSQRSPVRFYRDRVSYRKQPGILEDRINLISTGRTYPRKVKRAHCYLIYPHPDDVGRCTHGTVGERLDEAAGSTLVAWTETIDRTPCSYVSEVQEKLEPGNSVLVGHK